MSESILNPRGVKKIVGLAGIIGSVEYDKTNDILYGKFINVEGDLISYEGNNYEELQSDFINAVKDYLDYCKEKGIKPKIIKKGDTLK